MRRLYGQDKYHKPSRFIRELPETCLQEVRMKAQVSRPTTAGRFSQTEVKNNFNETGFNLGERVMHPKFGEGRSSTLKAVVLRAVYKLPLMVKVLSGW